MPHILDGIERFQPRRHNILTRQQEPIATRVSQLDLIGILDFEFVIEPVEGAAATRFDPWPELLFLLPVLLRVHAPFAGGSDAVLFPVRHADGFRETEAQLLEVFKRGRGAGAAVGIGVEDLLRIAVEVDERDDADVVFCGFVARPVGEPARLDALEGTFARETLGARVVGDGAVVIPLEGVRMVEIDASAETEEGLLSVLAPQPVVLPGVDVAVGVHGGDEDPVELFE